ncbi:hypothetical protein GCM10010923_02950 [Blastomonas marina]|uniref:Uncharacterized protein n=2 Tax=Blastomonas marina TaxID=1867408 RepID=A0ABQ1F3D5_9SPHN|nr:hypothetical protein GCM10010923_02950 [Blastomonas marina]
MLSFSAEFPLKSGTPSDVLSCIATWLRGSPHRVLAVEDIEKLATGEKEKIEAKSQTAEVINLKGSTSVGLGAKHTAIDHGIIYSTTVVSRVWNDATWVSIRTDRASIDTHINLREAQKPQIIKLLLKHLKGGLDGELWVRDKPHLITNADQNMAIRLLNGDSDNHIPVVYLSRTFRDELACDPLALARHLGGLAHVVVEPSRSFSREIQPFTNSRNAYGGAVGVYLPTGQRSLIIPDNEDEWNVRKRASEVVRASLLTRLPIAGFSWADLEAEKSRQNIEALKVAGSTDLDAFVREFDAENQALRDQNEALKVEIGKLKTEVQNLNAVSSTSGAGVKKPIAVQDYFPGESEQFLKDAVEAALKQVVSGSRREAVLQEFFDRMRSSDEFLRRRKALKETLSSSDDLDAKATKLLQEFGFSITSDGKHHKLTYHGDPKLTFTMSKTSSDWRAGKNMASEIIKKIF